MPTVLQTVCICPIYRNGPNEYWVRCPVMEACSKPAGTPTPNIFGCCSPGGGSNPNCISEVRSVEVTPYRDGTLSGHFPDFKKLPRDTATCPLVERGRIEELHSSERLFLAADTQETHLLRLYLLSVTVPNVPQFYWPVGFEVEGYEPGLQLPVVTYKAGTTPEYLIEFSSIAFDVLVERNGL